MPAISKAFRTVCLLALALLAHGCGSGDDDIVRVAVIGHAAEPFETGKRLPYAAQLVRAATAEGLVALDDQGRVVPALAERWIVTEGGLAYIFRLRDGTWPDDSRITGESAAEALRKAVANQAGTALGGDLAGVTEIIARAGRVVEVRLSRPSPDLLQLLTQPELGLSRKGKGAGPMRLRRDRDTAILRAIAPVDRGASEIPDWEERSRRVQVDAMSAARAIERLRDGEAAVILGGTFADYPLARTVGLARGTVVIDPAPGLFGLAVQRGHPFLAAPDNREALAFAIDREALAAALKAGSWQPSTRIVSPGLEGDPGTQPDRWAGSDMEERRSEAAARVANWQQGDKQPLRLRLALPKGPGADLLFARLASDMQAIGIQAVRVGENAEADLRLIDAVARYPRAGWFFNQLSCAAGRVLCSVEADQLADAARLSEDAGERAALFDRAETALNQANGFIPLGPPLRWSILSRGETGLLANRAAVHPLLSFALLPR